MAASSSGAPDYTHGAGTSHVGVPTGQDEAHDQAHGRLPFDVDPITIPSPTPAITSMLALPVIFPGDGVPISQVTHTDPDGSLANFAMDSVAGVAMSKLLPVIMAMCCCTSVGTPNVTLGPERPGKLVRFLTSSFRVKARGHAVGSWQLKQVPPRFGGDSLYWSRSFMRNTFTPSTWARIQLVLQSTDAQKSEALLHRAEAGKAHYAKANSRAIEAEEKQLHASGGGEPPAGTKLHTLKQLEAVDDHIAAMLGPLDEGPNRTGAFCDDINGNLDPGVAHRAAAARRAAELKLRLDEARDTAQAAFDAHRQAADAPEESRDEDEIRMLLRRQEAEIETWRRTRDDYERAIAASRQSALAILASPSRNVSAPKTTIVMVPIRRCGAAGRTKTCAAVLLFLRHDPSATLSSAAELAMKAAEQRHELGAGSAKAAQVSSADKAVTGTSADPWAEVYDTDTIDQTTESATEGASVGQMKSEVCRAPSVNPVRSMTEGELFRLASTLTSPLVSANMSPAGRQAVQQMARAARAMGYDRLEHRSYSRSALELIGGEAPAGGEPAGEAALRPRPSLVTGQAAGELGLGNDVEFSQLENILTLDAALATIRSALLHTPSERNRVKPLAVAHSEWTTSGRGLALEPGQLTPMSYVALHPQSYFPETVVRATAEECLPEELRGELGGTPVRMYHSTTLGHVRPTVRVPLSMVVLPGAYVVPNHLKAWKRAGYACLAEHCAPWADATTMVPDESGDGIRRVALKDLLLAQRRDADLHDPEDTAAWRVTVMAYARRLADEQRLPDFPVADSAEEAQLWQRRGAPPLSAEGDIDQVHRCVLDAAVAAVRLGHNARVGSIRKERVVCARLKDGVGALGEANIGCQLRLASMARQDALVLAGDDEGGGGGARGTSGTHLPEEPAAAAAEVLRGEERFLADMRVMFQRGTAAAADDALMGDLASDGERNFAWAAAAAPAPGEPLARALPPFLAGSRGAAAPVGPSPVHPITHVWTDEEGVRWTRTFELDELRVCGGASREAMAGWDQDQVKRATHWYVLKHLVWAGVLPRRGSDQRPWVFDVASIAEMHAAKMGNKEAGILPVPDPVAVEANDASGAPLGRLAPESVVVAHLQRHVSLDEALDLFCDMLWRWRSPTGFRWMPPSRYLKQYAEFRDEGIVKDFAAVWRRDGTMSRAMRMALTWAEKQRAEDKKRTGSSKGGIPRPPSLHCPDVRMGNIFGWGRLWMDEFARVAMGVVGAPDQLHIMLTITFQSGRVVKAGVPLHAQIVGAPGTGKSRFWEMLIILIAWAIERDGESSRLGAFDPFSGPREGCVSWCDEVEAEGDALTSGEKTLKAGGVAVRRSRMPITINGNTVYRLVVAMMRNACSTVQLLNRAMPRGAMKDRYMQMPQCQTRAEQLEVARRIVTQQGDRPQVKAALNNGGHTMRYIHFTCTLMHRLISARLVPDPDLFVSHELTPMLTQGLRECGISFAENTRDMVRHNLLMSALAVERAAFAFLVPGSPVFGKDPTPATVALAASLAYVDFSVFFFAVGMQLRSMLQLDLLPIRHVLLDLAMYVKASHSCASKLSAIERVIPLVPSALHLQLLLNIGPVRSPTRAVHPGQYRPMVDQRRAAAGQAGQMARFVDARGPDMAQEEARLASETSVERCRDVAARSINPEAHASLGAVLNCANRVPGHGPADAGAPHAAAAAVAPLFTQPPVAGAAMADIGSFGGGHSLGGGGGAGGVLVAGQGDAMLDVYDLNYTQLSRALDVDALAAELSSRTNQHLRMAKGELANCLHDMCRQTIVVPVCTMTTQEYRDVSSAYERVCRERNVPGGGLPCADAAIRQCIPSWANMPAVGKQSLGRGLPPSGTTRAGEYQSKPVLRFTSDGAYVLWLGLADTRWSAAESVIQSMVRKGWGKDRILLGTQFESTSFLNAWNMDESVTAADALGALAHSVRSTTLGDASSARERARRAAEDVLGAGAIDPDAFELEEVIAESSAMLAAASMRRLGVRTRNEDAEEGATEWYLAQRVRMLRTLRVTLPGGVVPVDGVLESAVPIGRVGPNRDTVLAAFEAIDATHRQRCCAEYMHALALGDALAAADVIRRALQALSAIAVLQVEHMDEGEDEEEEEEEARGIATGAIADAPGAGPTIVEPDDDEDSAGRPIVEDDEDNPERPIVEDVGPPAADARGGKGKEDERDGDDDERMGGRTSKMVDHGKDDARALLSPSGHAMSPQDAAAHAQWVRCGCPPCGPQYSARTVRGYLGETGTMEELCGPKSVVANYPEAGLEAKAEALAETNDPVDSPTLAKMVARFREKSTRASAYKAKRARLAQADARARQNAARSGTPYTKEMALAVRQATAESFGSGYVPAMTTEARVRAQESFGPTHMADHMQSMVRSFRERRRKSSRARGGGRGGRRRRRRAGAGASAYVSAGAPRQG